MLQLCQTTTLSYKCCYHFKRNYKVIFMLPKIRNGLFHCVYRLP